MADLLPLTELPEGFEYPREFVRVVELGLTKLEPWWIIEGDQLRERFLGLAKRYETRSLVPFAARQDNDDVACWDVDRGTVVVVHDYASSGYEQRLEMQDFFTWFRMAIEDFIAFD